MYSNGRPDCSRCVHNCPQYINNVKADGFTADKIVLSPNPVGGTFSVKVSQASLLEIYNGAGALAKTVPLSAPSTVIETSDLQPGIHVLCIKQNNKRWTNKILVTRR
jgi:hypothetical protein